MSKVVYMEKTIQEMGKINSKKTQKLIDSGEVVNTETNLNYLIVESSVDNMEEPIPTRKLINGETADELEEAHELLVYTKCPGKWILQDLETGQVYRGTDSKEVRNQWREVIQEPQSPRRK